MGLNEERNSMDNDTTTDQATDVDTGADIAQPVTDDVDVSADVQTQTEPSDAAQDTDTQQADDTSDTTAGASQVDDKLQKFAASQGIELDSPNAIKAAQVAMKAQSEATRNYRKSNELEKATKITDDQVKPDATVDEQAIINNRNKELVTDAKLWRLENPDKAQYEPQMAELIVKDANKRLMLQQGLLSYDDLFLMARGSVDTTANVKSQAKQEVLQSLAHKQQAAVPTGNATTPGVTPKTKNFADLSIQEMEAKLGKVRR